MDKLFLTILNMSFCGAFVVAAICLVRLPLRKAPKIISYCLWAVAGFRLAFPHSIESAFSLIPFKALTIPTDIATQPVPRIDSGIPFVNDAVGRILPSPPANVAANANPLQAWTAIGSWLWLAGAVAMLAVGVATYIRLKRNVCSAIRVEGNVYETDAIQSPFVLGALMPKIYVPLGLSGHEREYIILHERTHIRRHDHSIKIAAYLILCLHWFNPLAWAAFLLMGVDMEMSCDERVLKELGGGIKKDYSMSLLSFAVDRGVASVSPIAFGEDGVEKRIKNVLKYRKAPRVAVALAVALVTVLSLGLMANRASSSSSGGGDGSIDDSGEATRAMAGDSGEAARAIAGDLDEAARAIAGDLGDADFMNIDLSYGSGTDAEEFFNITDYYNEDGSFSDLGTGLGIGTGIGLGSAPDATDSERELAVSGGDTLIVGARVYKVTVESLTLTFYTQPSLNQAIQWWTDYLNSWTETGKITAVS